jgi:hypothetical protein
MILTIGRKAFAVTDLAHASQVYVRERDKAEQAGRGGARNVPSGIVKIETGDFFISYNGRVWEGSPGSNDAKLVMEAQS